MQAWIKRLKIVDDLALLNYSTLFSLEKKNKFASLDLKECTLKNDKTSLKVKLKARERCHYLINQETFVLLRLFKQKLESKGSKGQQAPFSVSEMTVSPIPLIWYSM